MLETLVQFHQLGAKSKLQKARLFLLIFQNVVIYKMIKRFEVYALCHYVIGILTDDCIAKAKRLNLYNCWKRFCAC